MTPRTDTLAAGKAPVLDGFGNMARGDAFIPRQVSYRARHFEDAVVGVNQRF